MRASHAELYVHLVWATWNREPLLTRDTEAVVYRSILSECRRLGAEARAVGGVADHVHVLVRLPTTLSIARLVQQLKGVSSRYAERCADPGVAFRWQVGYGAFTVSRWDVTRIERYIRHQKEHHRT